MTGVDLFEKGGSVMYVLAALSIYGLAVVFYKLHQFVTSGVFVTAFVDRAMGDIKRGELTSASNKLAQIKGPVARIMRAAIECIMNRDMTQESRQAEISRVGAAEIQYLETHMRGLEMIATTAPLLGLLGTVMGMVKAFAQLSAAGSRVDPSVLAGGIWEALLTTVAGLAIAIPAVAAYYLIDGIIEKVRASMKDVTIQILALEDRYIKNEKEQQRRELMEREDALKKALDEQQKALSTVRSTPQSVSTLRLLNPSYSQF